MPWPVPLPFWPSAVGGWLFRAPHGGGGNSTGLVGVGSTLPSTAEVAESRSKLLQRAHAQHMLEYLFLGARVEILLSGEWCSAAAEPFVRFPVPPASLRFCIRHRGTTRSVALSLNEVGRRVRLARPPFHALPARQPDAATRSHGQTFYDQRRGHAAGGEDIRPCNASARAAPATADVCESNTEVQAWVAKQTEQGGEVWWPGMEEARKPTAKKRRVEVKVQHLKKHRVAVGDSNAPYRANATVRAKRALRQRCLTVRFNETFSRLAANVHSSDARGEEDWGHGLASRKGDSSVRPPRRTREQVLIDAIATIKGLKREYGELLGLHERLGVGSHNSLHGRVHDAPTGCASTRIACSLPRAAAPLNARVAAAPTAETLDSTVSSSILPLNAQTKSETLHAAEFSVNFHEEHLCVQSSCASYFTIRNGGSARLAHPHGNPDGAPLSTRCPHNPTPTAGRTHAHTHTHTHTQWHRTRGWRGSSASVCHQVQRDERSGRHRGW